MGAVDKFDLSGPSAPDGKHYCDKHIVDALKPPPAAKVSFSHNRDSGKS